MFSDTFLRRFWSRVHRTDSCWIWTAARSHGYGHMAVTKTRNERAHRISWMIAHGRNIPDGHVICHHCDNPPCVNPEHLFLGTRMDNTRDMIAKGRMVKPVRRRGEGHHNAILTDAQVSEARAKVAIGSSVASLAAELGVQTGTLWRAVTGKNFSHLPGAVRPAKNAGQRQAKPLRAFGKTMTMAQWSAETGVAYHRIRQRLRRGWSPEDAVTL